MHVSCWLPDRLHTKNIKKPKRNDHALPQRTSLHPWQPGLHRRGAGQSRHARCAQRGRAAALPQAIPVGSARGGNPARGVVVHSERHHPAFPFLQVGREIRQHLDRGRLATARAHPAPGRRAGGAAGRARSSSIAGGVCHALRHAFAARSAGSAEATGLHAHPGVAGLSAVFGHDHRFHLRCRLRSLPPGAQHPRAAPDPQLSRPGCLHPGAAPR